MVGARIRNVHLTSLSGRNTTYFNLSSEATKQFEFHPFRCLWTTENVTDNIRARREIMLKPRLASTLHIG
jgi:hypothetical protein